MLISFMLKSHAWLCASCFDLCWSLMLISDISTDDDDASCLVLCCL